MIGALLLSGCTGGAQPASVTWRNVELPVPDGWYVIEQADTRLSLANADLRPGSVEDGGLPDGELMGIFLTYEPATLPDDWRRFVVEQDATLESDLRIELDGEVPATQLVYRFETDGIPTREMVVVIPSRAIVMLAQPIPRPGDTDAPEVFLRNVDLVVDVLEQARFGRPLLD